MTIDSLQHEPPAESPAHTDQTEQRELLEQALNRIDPDLSAIFLLREVENYTYDEIAAVLDISEGTVASRLNRARRKLREQLVELGWET
jgi:RNA polymerase sigma-70 factor (ECF subfamily)